MHIKTFLFGCLTMAVILGFVTVILIKTQAVTITFGKQDIIVNNVTMKIVEQTSNENDIVVKDNLQTSIISLDNRVYFPVNVISSILDKPVTWAYMDTNVLYIWPHSTLTKSDFDTIKLGMPQSVIESKVGSGNVFVTSGLHQIGYSLDDGTIIILYYRANVLSEIYIIDQNGNRTTLIETK